MSILTGLGLLAVFVVMSAFVGNDDSRGADPRNESSTWLYGLR